MKYTEEMSEKLNDLLVKNMDAEKTYRSAAGEVDDPDLKAFLTEKALQRYDFRQELKTEIRNYGESPEKGSSIAGDAKRSWMNLKASLSPHAEETVLDAIKTGEDTAVEDYDQVLEEANFPPSTENILKKQRLAIQKTLEEIENLKTLRRD